MCVPGVPVHMLWYFPADCYLYMAEQVPRATKQVMLQYPLAELTQKCAKDGSNLCCSNYSFLQGFRQVEMLSHFRQCTAYQPQIPTCGGRSRT